MSHHDLLDTVESRKCCADPLRAPALADVGQPSTFFVWEDMDAVGTTSKHNGYAGNWENAVDPLGLWPTHGLDPLKPDEQFEHGDAWYLVMILPLRLPHWLVLYTAETGQPIIGAFYEGFGGWAAGRADSRFKLLVFRRIPPALRRRGWAVIHSEVVGDEAAAEELRVRMLTDWASHSFETARMVSRAELRARLKAL